MGAHTSHGHPDEQALLRGIGTCLRNQRDALGLSRRQVAEMAGLSERFLSQVEAGQGNIAVTRLARLAAALNATPADIMACATMVDRLPVVVLVGLRGAGKSSLGGAVAAQLQIPFVEHDRLVEDEAGLALGELFELHGEAWYREIGRRILVEHLDSNTGPEVLAASGGIVTDPDAFGLLLERCHTIWLKADADEHWNRVAAQGDRRPMHERSDARSVLRTLLTERQPLYAAARRHVETGNLRFEAAVERLAEAVADLLGEPHPRRKRTAKAQRQ